MQNKSVLISIQPQWCELILRGKKTVEVRKSRPKLKPPFRCYIYCTYGNVLIEHNDIIHPDHLAEGIKVSKNKIWDNCCNGKVIGEFVCNDIFEIVKVGYTMREALQYRAVKDCTVLSDDIFDHSCLSKNAIEKYLDGRKGYAWHISNLVIYDKPKELGEFYKPCIYAKSGECIGIRCDKALFTRTGLFDDCGNILSKAPQSWCYVEELENG